MILSNHYRSNYRTCVGYVIWPGMTIQGRLVVSGASLPIMTPKFDTATQLFLKFDIRH